MLHMMHLMSVSPKLAEEVRQYEFVINCQDQKTFDKARLCCSIAADGRSRMALSFSGASVARDGSCVQALTQTGVYISHFRSSSNSDVNEK